jgi:hypothetical protein
MEKKMTTLKSQYQRTYSNTFENTYALWLNKWFTPLGEYTAPLSMQRASRRIIKTS